MKQVFGFLFLILAIILILVQIGVFVATSGLPGGRMALMTCITIGSLITGSLVYEEKEKRPLQIAGAITCLVCISLIITIAIQLLSGSYSLTGGEYAVLVIYAVASGIFGIAALTS